MSTGGDCVNTEERLRELMEERGLNMYSLAKRSNLSWNTVKNIFSQKSKPTLTTLEMLCDGLGITLAQFFDTTDALVSLTSSQQHLLNQWNRLTDQEKLLIQTLMEYMLARRDP